MKKTLAYLLPLAALVLAALACAGSPEPATPQDFAGYKRLASERGVPLLIDFWKDG